MSDFTVTFWGVRGSLACPGPAYARSGGNTSCLEVCCGKKLLIFDGGTGLRPLGRHIDAQGVMDADLYFTHTHFDHICGIPFFSSAYAKTNRLRMWAGHLLPDHTLRYVLSEMMMAPLFPIPIAVLGADLSFHDFRCGETLTPEPGVKLKTTRFEVLTRQRYTESQVGLNRTARDQNVRGAFDVRQPQAVQGRAVLLIDDVYTTGATVKECARVLQRAGAVWVGVYTLARVGGGTP